MSFFHGTHPSHRASIERDGLKPQPVAQDGQAGTWPNAVFLTPNADEASEYGTDVWEADLDGVEHDLVDGPDGYHVITPTTIPPNRLRRL